MWDTSEMSLQEIASVRLVQTLIKTVDKTCRLTEAVKPVLYPIAPPIIRQFFDIMSDVCIAFDAVTKKYVS